MNHIFYKHGKGSRYMNISKTNYTCARQCYKRLWLSKYKKELAVYDESTESKFRTGHLVGKHAWSLFPGDTCVDCNEDISIMAAATKKLLDNGTRVIYEAAFVCGNLIAVCDILVSTEEGLEVYEIKSSTGLRETYFDDISFQCYVLRKCGFTVSKASIVHINSQYVRHGALEYDKLFTINDVTDIVNEYYDEIEKTIPEIEKMLAGEMPKVDIGLQCSNPYPCEFKAYCMQHIPEYSVFDLYRIGEAKALSLYHEGVVSIKDVYDKGIRLNGIQKLQVEAEISRQSYIDKAGIREFLHKKCIACIVSGG